MSNSEDRGLAPCLLPGRNTHCFSCQWLLLGVTKSASKNFKNIFFQDKFYSKAHPYYFPVLIYVATWRAAEIDIFTHSRFINLLQYRQSINSLMYVYCTDPSCFLWALDHSRDDTSLYYRHPLKNFCIIPVYNLETCSNSSKGLGTSLKSPALSQKYVRNVCHRSD